MKKLLLATILLGTAFVAQAKDITFAMEPTYPPFEFTNEKGEIIGFDVDIANALCKEIQANCSFKSQAFDALIQGVKQKRFDASISGIGITEARQKQVLFSEPYFESSAAFIAKKGSDFSKAKTIGVQNGTTYQNYLLKEKTNFEVKAYASFQDALLDIQNGRIDAIFGDIPVLVDMINKTPGLDFIGEKIDNKAYFGNGLGIATNKSNQALVDEFNKALATIKANGEYQKIYDKWMTAK
ncbi:MULTISPECIES: arginine ABC transporter substrate-binding protein [Pasteurellaceae]|uniref:Lysine-arginine-ornithine-binding periplasmic protein n=1 Tax=Pasteurella bettyae CCUG 2042 TaxID=1095749 RepID=I3DHJ5_9PAST|nr:MULTISPECIES: arginine ABC transporter substrate-binding protein [Pasteurellaceae]EIJ71188.1 lysine-arginine-ornithine-binding periplasmic protein [Pasteurella bettyae CCUG 2042]SUB20988.1 ABC transporter arginine-binding protein [Pasteurella bettyae]